MAIFGRKDSIEPRGESRFGQESMQGRGVYKSIRRAGNINTFIDFVAGVGAAEIFMQVNTDFLRIFGDGDIETGDGHVWSSKAGNIALAPFTNIVTIDAGGAVGDASSLVFGARATFGYDGGASPSGAVMRGGSGKGLLFSVNAGTTAFHATSGGDTKFFFSMHMDQVGGAANAIYTFSKDVQQTAGHVFRTGSAARWSHFVDGINETGSDAGSDWRIDRYDDAGVAIDTALLITRATGEVTLTAGLTLGGDIIMASAVSQLIPGITSFALRDNADSADNFIVTDAGEITFRNHIDVNFTADANDEYALKLNVDAATFGDVKALDIIYTTGALSAGEDEAIILINLDESASNGGDITGLEILSTTGSASVFGMTIGAGVAPIKQFTGTFSDMDVALVNVTDRLTEFLSTGSDIQMFVANGDTVTIGDAAKFEEIEFLLAIVAGSAGIKPKFEFSNGAGWTEFSPVDGTNGMKNSGIIAWDDSDIPSWAKSGSEFLIRITRERANVTSPTEDLVQIAAVTVHSWSKDGDLIVNGIVTGADILSDTDSTDDLGSTGVRWANLWVDDITLTAAINIGGALNHDGSTVGFYATAPISQQTGVAVDSAGIHAACVALGLFTA